MRMMLLAAAGTLAALGFAGSAAHAQQAYVRGFYAPPSARSYDRHRGLQGDDRRSGGWGREDGHSCMDRDHCGAYGRGGRGGSDVVLYSYGGEWAAYNNRSWDSDSYNDWWHDRPDRSMPRWVTHNEGCQRLWYAGDTLRC